MICSDKDFKYVLRTLRVDLEKNIEVQNHLFWHEKYIEVQNHHIEVQNHLLHRPVKFFYWQYIV